MLDPNEQIDGLVKIVDRTERERDEAREATQQWMDKALNRGDAAARLREALRDLLAAADEHTTPRDDWDGTPEGALAEEPLSVARRQARALLEGVERTHALLPNAALEQIRRLLFFYPPSSDPRDAERVRLAPEFARAIEAATRGEHQDWPAAS